ncbi:MAG TPA: tRNA pseudouridine(13) synthase TruD [Planctomycetaceae bacterium]|nr:tRNA pseudouridine(13) synthase TruD [Planctomycetaceae bacterium]
MDTPPATSNPLPYLTGDLPGIGGELKTDPDDFIVEEVPAYLPSGEGEHLFLWIEKRGLSAEMLLRHLGKSLGISTGDIGVAGMKDRQATTRQWVSVPARCEERLAEVDGEGVRLLDHARHSNKLKTGHLRGNRFTLLLRNVGDDALARAQAIAAVLVQHGFPNYFGAQRFGADADNADLGFALLRGTRTPGQIPPSRRKFLLKLALSAAQSALFNELLARRVREGTVARVMNGDVMQVCASGGLFTTSDPVSEQARLDHGELAITGPMFGPKMRQPLAEPANLEQAALAAHELTDADFLRFKKLTTGTRRPYLVRADDLEIEQTDTGLRFRFSLPPGCYATVLLREFQKSLVNPADIL